MDTLPPPAGHTAWVMTILSSGLFEPDYYATQSGSAFADAAAAVTHYLGEGEAAGLRPTALFDPDFYRRHYLEQAPPDTNALLHYITQGADALAIPGAGFLPRQYARLAGLDEEGSRHALRHWLRDGRAAGLVPPALPAADQLEIFRRWRSRYCLMRFRLALVAALGRDEGFRIYRALAGLPDTESLAYKPLKAIVDTARAPGASFHLIRPAGGPSAIPPPRVVGEGNHRPLIGHTRSHYLACIPRARVRGASSLVETDTDLLFDVEGDELEAIDTEFAFDAAVFAGDNAGAWVIRPAGDAAALQVREAFSMLGARTVNFGHWMWEHFLKYANVRAAGFALDMPVLIDGGIPPAHRQSLEVLYPGINLVEVPPYQTVAVERLWVAPTLQYSSIFERRNAKFCWDALICPEQDVASALAEARARAGDQLPADGPRRVYLARHDWRHRKLENRERIEGIARDAGFTIAYPETLDFAGQSTLLRNAEAIIAPEGSAVALCMFAPRGARLMLLDGPTTDILVTYRPYFDAIGLGMVVIAGRTTHRHAEWEELSDYEIDEDVFAGELHAMLAGHQPPDQRRPGAR